MGEGKARVEGTVEKDKADATHEEKFLSNCFRYFALFESSQHRERKNGT
jgi:hypothetical protein